MSIQRHAISNKRELHWLYMCRCILRPEQICFWGARSLAHISYNFFSSVGTFGGLAPPPQYQEAGYATELTHANCNNLPQGGIFFTRNTCQSNTHAHKAVIIPSICTSGILNFHTLSIFRCSWIFFAARWIFENVNKLLGEVNIFLFFFLP